MNGKSKNDEIYTKNALTTTFMLYFMALWKRQRRPREKRNKLISSIYLWQKCEFSHENKRNISHASWRRKLCSKFFLYIIYYLHITQYTYVVLKCLKTQRLQLYYGNLNLHGFMVVTTTCLINFVDSVSHG